MTKVICSRAKKCDDERCFHREPHDSIRECVYVAYCHAECVECKDEIVVMHIRESDLIVLFNGEEVLSLETEQENAVYQMERLFMALGWKPDVWRMYIDSDLTKLKFYREWAEGAEEAYARLQELRKKEV